MSTGSLSSSSTTRLPVGVQKPAQSLVIPRHSPRFRSGLSAGYGATQESLPSASLRGDSWAETILQFPANFSGQCIKSENYGSSLVGNWWNDANTAGNTALRATLCPVVSDLSVDGRATLRSQAATYTSTPTDPTKPSRGQGADAHGPDLVRRADGLCLQGAGLLAKALRFYAIPGSAVVLKSGSDAQAGALGIYDNYTSQVEDVAAISCLDGLIVETHRTSLTHVAVRNAVQDGIRLAGDRCTLADGQVTGADRAIVFLLPGQARDLSVSDARIGVFLGAGQDATGYGIDNESATAGAHGTRIDNLDLGDGTCYYRGLLIKANNCQVAGLTGAVHETSSTWPDIAGIELQVDSYRNYIQGHLRLASTSDLNQAVGAIVGGHQHHLKLTGEIAGSHAAGATFVYVPAPGVSGRLSSTTVEINCSVENTGTILDLSDSGLDAAVGAGNVFDIRGSFAAATVVRYPGGGTTFNLPAGNLVLINGVDQSGGDGGFTGSLSSAGSQVAYDAEADIGLVAYDDSDAVAAQNTSLLNAALDAMWRSGSFAFQTGPAGPILKPIFFDGKEFFFKGTIKGNKRIGGALHGFGARGYLMWSVSDTPGWPQGGARTIFTRIDGENATVYDETVGGVTMDWHADDGAILRLCGNGLRVSGIEFRGRPYLGPSAGDSAPYGPNDASWGGTPPYRTKTPVGIEVEGSAWLSTGDHMLRDCSITECVVGICCRRGWYPANGQGTLTTWTSNSAGTLTMATSGHGIPSDSYATLTWSGGRRAVRLGTVSGTSVPIQSTSGYGDNLPAQNTAVKVSFLRDGNHADNGSVNSVLFHGCDILFRTENEQSVIWKLNDIDVRGWSAPTAAQVKDMVVLDCVLGGNLWVNGLSLNHSKATILRVGNEHYTSYSQNTSQFDIQNIKVDRMADPVNSYVTFFDYNGPIYPAGMDWLTWSVRFTGHIAAQAGEFDESRLLRIPDALAATGIDRSNLLFDVWRLPETFGSDPSFDAVGNWLTPTDLWRTYNLQHGLVAHYKLDDGSGATATDELGTYPGTLSGASWTTGSIGGGLSFASGNHVDIANLSLYTNTTLAFRVYLNSYTSGVIISKVGTTACGVRVESSGSHVYVTSGLNGSGTNHVDIGAWVTPGAWHDVVITFSGGLAALVYVDGVQRGSFNMTSGYWLNEAIDLRLGAPSANFYGSGTAAANMKLDEVRAYNYVLPAGAAQQLHALWRYPTI